MIHTSGPETLHKPRILCLHGGGVSAKIFRLQARRLLTSLSPYFRLVFTDGPYQCAMHDDLKPVYNQMGPCYSWVSHHITPSGTGIDAVSSEIEDSLRIAMKADPGTGEWVGLLGFSQGARLAASILLENQLRWQEVRWNAGQASAFAGVQWKFGTLMAGRGPPLALSNRTGGSPFFDLPGAFAAVDLDWDRAIPENILLRTPTLHVHGIRDEGLPFHRQLLRKYMSPGRATLVEWDGEHRVPIRTVDVEEITKGILQMAKVRSL